MMTLPQHTSVLIVGAGPSGLMMAAQLLRNGVQPIIIDIKKGPTNQSKALVVQARSLEIYRQMGIVDQVLKAGTQVAGASFYQDGKQQASLSLTGIGEGQTLYPYLELFQQSKNERLLLDYLTKACCPVYWDTTVTSLYQNTNHVSVTLKNGEKNYAFTCDWVIGADGAHSTVRKQSGISFNGDTYQHNFYLADIKLDNKDLEKSYVQLFFAKDGFAGFFPMPEEGYFRIVGNIQPKFKEKENLLLEDVVPYINKITARSLQVSNLNWFTTYRLHHRMAGAFRDQRCFLIGDAAHIHSPVGGQGMNTGLQDAYNLAWKLAGVINKQLKPDILNSYAEERMPVAKDLLKTTDRAFSMIMSGNWFVNLIKGWLLPKVLNRVWRSEKSRANFFKRISQTGINYRDSKLNLQLGQSTHIKAGDRLPYFEIYDEKKKEKTDIHTWCSKPGFTLITLGDLQEGYLFTLAKWITQDYEGSINFFHLPPSNTNWHIFDAFEVKAGMRKALIIRPDMHIGYMNNIVDIDMMNNYLRNVVGFTI
jgi:2-polyprenyl-6-methoxyphenol hydroxylase-like FAD-dependent oxidoreductase